MRHAGYYANLVLTPFNRFFLLGFPPDSDQFLSSDGVFSAQFRSRMAGIACIRAQLHELLFLRPFQLSERGVCDAQSYLH